MCEKITPETYEKMNEDYITITSWDKQFECVRYHYVHKSSPNPVEEVKSLFPFEEVFENASSNLQ